jgi:flagellar FliJ protein
LDNYKFRLQKLLDIRKDKEEESKRIFKEAQLKKEKVEEKLDNLKNDYNRYKTAKPNETLVERKLKHIYLNALNVSINETSAELQEKVNILEEKRQELKQKQIDRKTVETLKNKQYEAFKKEQALIEQNSNDEFALYGFLRTREGR